MFIYFKKCRQQKTMKVRHQQTTLTQQQYTTTETKPPTQPVTQIFSQNKKILTVKQIQLNANKNHGQLYKQIQ